MSAYTMSESITGRIWQLVESDPLCLVCTIMETKNY